MDLQFKASALWTWLETKTSGQSPAGRVSAEVIRICLSSSIRRNNYSCLVPSILRLEASMCTYHLPIHMPQKNLYADITPTLHIRILRLCKSNVSPGSPRSQGQAMALSPVEDPKFQTMPPTSLDDHHITHNDLETVTVTVREHLRFLLPLALLFREKKITGGPCMCLLLPLAVLCLSNFV